MHPFTNSHDPQLQLCPLWLSFRSFDRGLAVRRLQIVLGQYVAFGVAVAVAPYFRTIFDDIVNGIGILVGEDAVEVG